MQACSTYFHQGSDLFEEVGPFIVTLNDEIPQMKQEVSALEKQLGSYHNLVGMYDSVRKPSPETGIQMEGYLFKRSSNAFKTWNRRWFYLTNNQLLYRKRTGTKSRNIELSSYCKPHLKVIERLGREPFFSISVF